MSRRAEIGLAAALRSPSAAARRDLRGAFSIRQLAVLEQRAAMGWITLDRERWTAPEGQALLLGYATRHERRR